MAKLSRKKGTASQIFHVVIKDSTSTTGAGKTGLAFNTASLVCRYINAGGTLSAAVTLEDITTLGTYAAPTSNAHMRFKEVSSADPSKGLYELHVHNDWMNLTGGNLIIMLAGAAGMADCQLEVDLQADANVTHLAGTAQTARDIGASVLLSSGTGAGQVSLSSGLVTLAGVTHTGAVIPTVTAVTNDVGITQAGADKAWASAARTLTSFGTLVADIWGYSARTLTAFPTALAISVWDVLETAILTAGSIGLKVKTNLDAAISSRLTAAAYTPPDNAGIASIFNIVNHVTYGLSALNADLDTIIAYVDELESRLTAARAGYLDNLSEGAVALKATLEAIKGVGWTTETLVAVKALVDDLEGRLTAARATLLDNLDSPISSIWSHSNRKLTSAYTDEATPRDMAATGSGGGGGSTVVVLPYSGSVQASYAKDGLMVEVIQGDSVSIPYDLATDLTGWTVRFGAKGSVADTAYAIAVKDITSSVTDLTNGRGLIPLTTTETSLAPGNYLGEIEIRKDSQVVTAMKFTVKIKGQVIN